MAIAGTRKGNPVEIQGDVALLFLERRDGVRVATLVDTIDLPRVQAFTWHASWNRTTESWHARTNTPKAGGLRACTLRMHRMLLDAPPDYEVDHVNGDTLDNRRSCNLRLAERGQNTANRRSFRGSVSPYKGVSPHRGRWRAQIWTDGLKISLGVFDTEEAAARAYDEAARHHHGAFAHLNFPDIAGAALAAVGQA